MEQDLEDEIRDHLERQTDANIARGMTRDEARYAALRAFGGVDQRKEECRDRERAISEPEQHRIAADCSSTQT